MNKPIKKYRRFISAALFGALISLCSQGCSSKIKTSFDNQINAQTGMADSQTAAYATQVLSYSPSLYLNFNDSTTAFTDQVSGLAFTNKEVLQGTPYTSGTVTPRQLGFDSTQAGNTSAAFSYNAFSAAPNNTLGAIDWNTPWTMMIHVDRLHWARSGTLVLASKGDSGSINNSYWKLYLQMNGQYSELCFIASGPNSTGAPFSRSTMSICTNGMSEEDSIDAMPNGYNYNIVVTNNGSGYTSMFNMYINGLQVGRAPSGNYLSIPGLQSSGSYQVGFNPVGIKLSGSGTGYANTTAITNNGTGGTNCVVVATMNATGGVPSSITYGTQTSGCTSLPALSLTSPTGTGAVLTPTLYTTSMNSPTLPLMVPGYVSSGVVYGVAGTTTTQSSVYIDEFAVFPGVLTSTQIQTLFYQTKFYQGLMKPLPATPPLLIFSEDGCGDTDNLFALAMAIAAHKLGYVNLVGVEDVNGDGISEAFFRQELDQAGLTNIPVSRSSTFDSNTTLCTSANIDLYDPSTPQTLSSYELSSTMYRTIFAENPTKPIYIVSGAPFNGIAEFMQSPADSISSLTGAQLWARNGANGGAVYAQGLGENITFGAYYDDLTNSSYVFDNNGAVPFYWYGGSPQSGGPGVLSTRASNDPLFLTFNSRGTDTRTCWDCMPLAAVISNLFAGGVKMTITGSGTGYADLTPFTSIGGGASCVVTGTLISVDGVPTSITSTGGSALNSYQGVGSGCFTASDPPTIVLTNPTGTGATLTAATTTSSCGTITETTLSNGTSSDAACTGQYFLPLALNATAGDAPLFQWFINSLVDPPPSLF